MEDLLITVSERDATGLVSVQGNIDTLTASQVSATLDQAVRKTPHMVLNLEAVDYMSSAGLRVILAALKQSRANGGDLRLSSPRPRVEKILKLAGFTSILQIFPSVEQAVESFTA